MILIIKPGIEVNQLEPVLSMYQRRGLRRPDQPWQRSSSF